MSIYDYFQVQLKTNLSLLSPYDGLSKVVPSTTIHASNKEIQNVIDGQPNDS